MKCRFTDLCNKEVINIKDGARIGFVDDVEINVSNACIEAIVIFGRSKCFGIFGREEDIVILWKDIEVIGEDTILVCFNGYKIAPKRRSFFYSFFNH